MKGKIEKYKKTIITITTILASASAAVIGYYDQIKAALAGG